MSRPLAAVERFFERLFERPAAKLFQTRVQPVQIQQRLERAMEADRRVSADKLYVPTHYRVLLNPTDLEAFATYRSSLESELADAILVRARRRGYTLLERPTVSLVASKAVSGGDVEIRTQLGDDTRAPDERAPAGEDGAPAPVPVDPTAGPPNVEHTAVFATPPVQAPQATIVLQLAGQAPERVILRGSRIRVGRSSDNDLILPDERVSRHHGQLAPRHGRLVYTDLGSTNGSFVNGMQVTEIALGPGDVLQLGDSAITIEGSG